MTGLPALEDILEEYEFLEAEDRYRLLIDLGRQLETMPDASRRMRPRSAAARPRCGFIRRPRMAACISSPTAMPRSPRGSSRWSWARPGQTRGRGAAIDVAAALAPFELREHLSANRTQGVPNMIALVKQDRRPIRRRGLGQYRQTGWSADQPMLWSPSPTVSKRTGVSNGEQFDPRQRDGHARGHLDRGQNALESVSRKRRSAHISTSPASPR